MKLSAALKRGEGVSKNIGNAISYMQTQDGALSTAANILDRMSELRTLADDVTKNTSDIANYNTEFLQLRSQLGNIAAEKFNGISLFTGSGTTFQGNSVDAATQLKVYTTEAGSSTGVAISATKSTLIAALNIKGAATGAAAASEANNLADFDAATTSATTASITAFTVTDITEAIQNVATLRAENGAYTSRLQFAQQQLQTNNANIESANSRIIDVDVARESTQFARYNILVQSGSAMLSQANGLSAIALSLLQ
jgi:flagellin